MPHVTPADKDKMALYKIIEKKEKVPVGYRMIQCDTASFLCQIHLVGGFPLNHLPEVPRCIIVGFQTDKSGDQEQNPSIFDNVDVKNIYATLNSNKYPTLDYNFFFRNNNLVGRMVMPLNLDLSFLI